MMQQNGICENGIHENSMYSLSSYGAVELIGAGASGRVYAIDEPDFEGRSQCVKVMDTESAMSEKDKMMAEALGDKFALKLHHMLKKQMLREVTMMEMLAGEENIVQLKGYSCWQSDDSPCENIAIRMERLTCLKDYLKEHELSREEIIRLGLDLCSTLDACEKAFIIHQDIKEANIFIDGNGTFKLGDFGVAVHSPAARAGNINKNGFCRSNGTDSSYSRRSNGTDSSYSRRNSDTDNNYSRRSTRAGSAYSGGSLCTVAPEVFLGGEPDSRSDLYSVGLVLYRILNHGKDPFFNVPAGQRETNTSGRSSADSLPTPESTRKEAFIRRISEDTLPMPDCALADADLAEVILKACRKNPDQRYQSAADFAGALQSLV